MYGFSKEFRWRYKIGTNSHLGEYCFIDDASGVKVEVNVIGGQSIRFHA